MKMKNMPVYSLIAAVILLVALVVMIIVAPSENISLQGSQIIAVVAGIIPGLIAAAFAERASKDIRNGTVQEKAKNGATEALKENQVLTRDGPVMTAQLEALTKMLAMIDETNKDLANEIKDRVAGDVPPEVP